MRITSGADDLDEAIVASRQEAGVDGMEGGCGRAALKLCGEEIADNHPPGGAAGPARAEGIA